MVQEIRSLQKLAIFFRVSRWGRRGGGLVRGTLRYIYILIAAIAAGAAGVSVSRSGGRVCASAEGLYRWRGIGSVYIC